ncbi:hypothetical protein [Methylocucumis oryzae]|uniref:Uncharacterized protein n=1 Tax=Methylocucumis oryzae TaxID=1632867 RepID=A0A0F3IHX8_9GAMM|nr:hypothetical protein [Methylocucumis oryzae]KJV05054.1 hypothetical protein VZ94_20935 [Methylocucumis oryzae]
MKTIKRDKNFQELGQSFSRESLSMLTKIPMERYRTKLDLDNDGDITDTIIKSTSLVSVSANVRMEVDGLFIVDKQLRQVEEAKMHDIFADKEILEWPSVAHFPPLAAPIDLFVYKGKTYFDGFINISFFWTFRQQLTDMYPLS